MTSDAGDDIKIRRLLTLYPCEGNDEIFMGIGMAWSDSDPEAPDQVGIVAQDESGRVAIVVEPGEALLIANRLTRAANLALESYEDPPDFSKEFRKLTDGS